MNMNYDKIILELMNRIQIMEEQVSLLNEKVAILETDFEVDFDEEDEVSEKDEITRSEARDRAINIIKDNFPEYIVEKASRKEGSGIKIISPKASSKKPTFIKFYHSKEHRSGHGHHGWHVVRLDDVIATPIDYCLLSFVDSKGDWSYFLYNQEEIGMYYDDHRSSSSNNILHLYFIVKDGKAKEVRENTVDVTDHLNNWVVLKNI
jgi:hypothetical protein